MSDQVYKLFANVAATTEAAAVLDIQFDGVIEGVLLNIIMTAGDALADAGRAEVSFASTSGFANNDTRASFAGIGVQQGFLTTGGGPLHDSVFLTLGKGIPIAAGERIYLHIQLFGGAGNILVSAWLYTATDGGGRASRRRI